jgi:hypothetical protein
VKKVMASTGVLLIVLTLCAFVVYCIITATLVATGQFTTEARAANERWLVLLMGLQCFGIVLGAAGSRK